MPAISEKLKIRGSLHCYPDISGTGKLLPIARTPNSILSIPNYQIETNLRIDRCDTQYGIGGGLLVYTRNGFTVLPIDNTSEFNKQCSFCSLDNSVVQDNFLTSIVLYQDFSSHLKFLST